MADWSDLEVDLIVEDYFQMLHEEIKGRGYNKTIHRKRLQQLLNNRPDGSIERKHQNISAILLKNGLPYINGYKPLSNFQKLLENKVLAFFARKDSVETDFEYFANQKIEIKPQQIQFQNWVDSPPNSTFIQEAKEHYYKPVKRNYLELEQNNRSIGFAGEELVYEYEKWRLINSGVPKLAKEVKWISKEQGDGAGYDILSRNIDGGNIFIEVKTTTLGKDAPIFFSKTENDFSNENKETFNLYRVFNVRQQPKMFLRHGNFKSMCNMEAVNFKGTF